MLNSMRVLDLTDHRGEVAGMVLGDLGADVIKVEPPEGSAGRRQGPRVEAAPELEASLSFFAYNRNKRSLVLDLGTTADRDTFLRLAATATIVLESAPPGELSRHGIGFEELRAASPQIVHVRITPFGDDGPYADYAASDLVLSALGGQAWLQGVAERAPVRVSVPQSWRLAGAEGAVAALIACERMARTGEAQHATVSAQCAMTWNLMDAMGPGRGDDPHVGRAGSRTSMFGRSWPMVFSCRNGDVTFTPMHAEMPYLLDWMVEDGVLDPDLIQRDWRSPYEPVSSPEEMRKISPAWLFDESIEKFIQLHDKTELLHRGLERGIRCAPVNTLEDLVDFDHLKARRFFTEAELPDGRTVYAPGSFVKPSSGTLSAHSAAPRLDQHRDEIRAEIDAAPRGRVPRAAASNPDTLPLEGLKVLDLTWLVAGPMATRILADHGATVVHVESPLRPDLIRGFPPFKDGIPGPNRSHFFADFNASKLSLTLDLKNPEGIEVAKRMLRWADVYIENMRPGAVDRLGLGYETARKLNPSIVMISSSLLGRTGPLAHMTGYGNHAAAMAGFFEVTGWPDLRPDGPYYAYTDVLAPRFSLAALLAALVRRRQTGEGCYFDASQLESSLQLLAPEILASQLDGSSVTRLGNRDPRAAPHGIYPCAGDDAWCAIAVETDEQWRSLRSVLGDPDWARDPVLDRLKGRLERHDDLDSQLSKWTSMRSPREAMQTLQASGVPAGAVQAPLDLLEDPQYRHLGFYRELEHSEMGRVPYVGHAYRIRGYENGPRTPAPRLGEHNDLVLRKLLGMSDAEVARAAALGAMGKTTTLS